MSASTNTTTQGALLNPRNFPRPPLCERTPRHLQIKWHGHTIADTREAFWVLETYHPPTYYLPPSSLQVQLIPSAGRQTFCEWKGMATYYDLTDPSGEEGKVQRRIWTYESPTAGFAGIKGYLSFYAGPWDCYVDGEKVEAQPGDFYGGWMTSDIERTSVKGGPGTRGW